MVGIPSIKMVLHGGWFMKLLSQHYNILTCRHHKLHSETMKPLAIKLGVKLQVAIGHLGQHPECLYGTPKKLVYGLS